MSLVEATAAPGAQQPIDPIEEGKAKARERARAWRAANPEWHRSNVTLYKKANPEKVKEYARKRRERNRQKRHQDEEYKLKVRARQREWSKKYRGRLRDASIMKKYGLTRKEWDLLFEAQGRACASCGSVTSRGKYGWHTDHDHKTGKVRGILCRGCNHMLGHAGDDPERLIKAAEYLRRHSEDYNHGG
jgi:hypothetical protein